MQVRNVISFFKNNTGIDSLCAACAASQCHSGICRVKVWHRPQCCGASGLLTRLQCCASIKLRKGEGKLTALQVTVMVPSQIAAGAGVSGRGINRCSQWVLRRRQDLPTYQLQLPYFTTTHQSGPWCPYSSLGCMLGSLGLWRHDSS